MNRNFLKTIIKEELEEIIMGPKALYVFDFDDTLVSDQATVYVVHEQNQTRTPLTVTEFHHYLLKEGEEMDFGEFEEVTDPAIHTSIMDLLVSHLPNVVILTARSEPQPIKDYLGDLGIDVPVIAVGKSTDDAEAIKGNAKRKRDWIGNAIRTRGLEYVEFWDDNEENINQVWSLQKKYPDVKIVCHLVRHRQ